MTANSMREANVLRYDDAMLALANGAKVKLPEWTGYWFMEDGKVLVHTREGDVIDTPYTADYINRNDWQVTNGLRDFGGALLALKAGKCVCRTGWNGRDMYLYLVPGSTFQVAEGRPLASHIPVGNEIEYHAHIDMKTAQGYHIPWLASQADMLADDWMIVDYRQYQIP